MIKYPSVNTKDQNKVTDGTCYVKAFVAHI